MTTAVYVSPAQWVKNEAFQKMLVVARARAELRVDHC